MLPSSLLVFVNVLLLGPTVLAFSFPISGENRSIISSKMEARKWGDLEEIRPSFYRLFLKDDGIFPNNPNHPLLLFRNMFQGSEKEGCKLLVEQGGWTTPWVWGVFTFHHYHSTAWEILVCVQGEADVQFGGPTGPIVKVAKGDIALVPPGVAHKQLNDRGGFALLGAYPQESPNADTIRGEPSTKQRHNIEECFTPVSEPITGTRLADMYSSIVYK